MSCVCHYSCGVTDKPRRMNVAINEAMIDAIQHVIDNEGVTLTEAVRRLIGYGDYVYRAIKDDHAEVVMHGKDGKMREMVLL